MKFTLSWLKEHLDTDADEATVTELHRKVAATSPVGQTLSKAIPVEITHQ